MMGNQRPTIATDEMRLAAATRIAEELVKGRHLEADEVEAAARDIARCGRRHMDGYELAKELDNAAYWDCNLDMAETLDGFGYELDIQIKAAQMAWFDAEKPTPPFAVGERVKFGRLAGKMVGTITGHYTHGIAQYLVKVDGEAAAEPPSNSRAIVDWEACEPANA